MTSTDFRVWTGLIDQSDWEWSRWYYVNVEDSKLANNIKDSQLANNIKPQNVNVSFNNNSSLPIDAMVFIFFSDELVIDVVSGVVTK